jgi:alcohol dehydrogenase (cytochrome c)
MKIRKLTFVMAAAVIVVILCVTTLQGQLSWSRSDEGPEPASYEKIWTAISCRLNLYLHKAEDKIPELSWSEVWGLSQPGSGFKCGKGGSLEASIQFSSIASADDRRAGASIFHEQCSGCHGNDGSGGSVGPSLTRPRYSHGDSDFAIYQVVRNGVPGTAMPRARLSLPEFLRVTAYVKSLQAHLSEDQEQPRLAINVSSERLQAAGKNTDEWLTYSGSYDGWRYTSLAKITRANVAQLRVRWIKQFDISQQSIQATPLVVDGVMFIVAEPGDVLALNAETGDVIWQYKRSVPSDLPLAYGPVNRGLAVSGGAVFFGTLDGHLIALNAADGKVIWETLVASPFDHYSITGAPLAVGRLVIVGIAGGEFGIRGFLAAYDVSSGQQQWKFYTIPGPGDVGHETWENDAWRTGGGGTWVTGSYDPSTDLLYWGVGNPSPVFLGDVRPGDNLFTASVIALHASTGKLAWYFQFTPHDEHDWDAAQTPILADLSIRGVVRNVICWANRNGFYYVLDRVTGEFLTGVPFVDVDWAKQLTAAGRPILVDSAKVSTTGRRIRPGIEATNWQNPAFDQERGSIFIAATEASSVFSKQPPNEVMGAPHGYAIGSGWSQIEPPTRLVVALDAATGSRRWQYKSVSGADRSGLLATGGGLVFGASGGILFALDADSGRELFKQSLGGTTKSAPISFSIKRKGAIAVAAADGASFTSEREQVIAVAAGRALFVFGL